MSMKNIQHTTYKIQDASNPRGFTTLFALLIASLLLAVGLAIYNITIKQVIFSSLARNSSYAIDAADTGIECALYWDFKCPSGVCGDGSGSAFATSTDSLGKKPVSGVYCNAQDIAATAAAANTWPIPAGSGPDGATASAATTTFEVQLSTGGSNTYCANVTVAKWGSPVRTNITSEGYSSCTLSDPTRTERVLQASY